MKAPPVSTVDPITFEILSHRLYQITKEIAITLEHVGGTVNTTQLKDYLAALYTPSGEVLSVGQAMMGMHAVCAGFAVKKIIDQFGKDGNIYPDDMFLLNDPYLAAIHQSDMYVVSPIHYQGRLVGWSATFVHVMDIGAMSPGGNSPGATEICHEGIRIPGIKLVERGQTRNDVFRTVVNMTRQPVMVGLDLKCEIAANNVAKARMQDMIKQYGLELIQAVSAQMIRYSESILRKRIAEIPDGSWTDSLSIQADKSWKVKLTLNKKGDRLIFDFAGTDRQAEKGINLPYHATFGCCFQEVLCTFAYDIPRNQGAFGPMEVSAPEGCVVNVQNPAPVSLNTTSGAQAVKHLAASVLMQAVAASEKWKREVMAPTLMGRFARHAGISQYGKYYVSTLLESGGSGATSCKDGMNSSSAGSIGMTCHNVEWVELNFPVIYLFRRHIVDGAGAGKYRGGAGTEVALAPYKPAEGKIKVVALGVAGLKNSGKGLFGGYPGAPSLLNLFESTKLEAFFAQNRPPVDLAELKGRKMALAYQDIDLQVNDVLYLRMACGGGYGDPLERDPQIVVQDLRNGLVSSAAAEQYYGVVVDRGKLNLDDTRHLRTALIRQRLNGRPATRLKPARASQSGAVGHGRRPTTEKTRPFRGNMEIIVNRNRSAIRCQRCLAVLSSEPRKWKEACTVKLLPPTEAGALMADLTGYFLLEQTCCPSCGILLDTELIPVP